MTSLFFLTSAMIFAQVESDQTAVDWGEIVRGSDRVVDITFENLGEESAFNLRSGFGFEYSIMWTNRSIAPGETETLRVKYNPRSKGKFTEEIPIYFSNMQEALVIRFSGDVQFIDNSENPACPSFSSRPVNCCDDDNNPGAWFEAIDAETGYPVSNARVRIVYNGRVIYDQDTDREGNTYATLEPTWYYMDVQHPDYLAVDSAAYINKQNDHYIFPLKRMTREQIDTPDSMEGLSSSPIKTKPMNEAQVMGRELPKNLPPLAEMKKNNIVLLIDVSQSMAGQGKIELLKSAVFELTEILRPVDRVSVLTYATRTDVLLEAVRGDQKEEIRGVINSLEAEGMTMGSKGFNRGYDLVNKYFIKEGNNELIVVTDGAFRSSDNPKIVGMVKEQAEQGVITSILGVKGRVNDSEELAGIAEKGRGNYLSIFNFDESRMILIHEIRMQSIP